MDYKALYQSKLTTPEEAVKCVHDGDWVAWGWGDQHPQGLRSRHGRASEDPARRAVPRRHSDVEPEMFDMPDAKDHFTWNSWHMSGIERKMIDRGFLLLLPRPLLRGAQVLPRDRQPRARLLCAVLSHG